VITESPNPTKHSAGSEAASSLRAWLFDAFALGMGASAVLHYRPDGFVAGLIVFVGAYVLAHSLQCLHWQSVRGLSQFLLCTLGVLIHFATLLTAPSSFTGLVFTFLLPGIAQAYWLWELWPATGAWSQPLSMMCAAWLGLLGVWFLAKTMTAARPALRSD
jgi:hypothetical protein